MLPKKHILFGLIASYILYLSFTKDILGVVLFFLSSFLIDFDHYLYFLFKKKSFSLKKAYQYSKNKINKNKKTNSRKYTTGIYIFHGFDVIAFVYILGFFISKYFYFVAAGMLFHLLLDLIEKIKDKRNPRKIFMILDVLRYESLKKI